MKLLADAKNPQDKHTWIRLSQVTLNITVGNRFKIKISLLEKQNRNYNWPHDKTNSSFSVHNLDESRELRLSRGL